ncbi:hypothetical protein PG991_009521 [Apiospora marii]|uniref:Uncharacterized protein n=1 Tax=Apiospora marii TaxID=335849 RepID=A0ABR1RK98_9PEZI
MPPARKRLAPTAGQINDIKLVRTSVLCNGDLATYPPQGRRGNNSAARVGKSHVPSASRALSHHQHCAHRLPADLSSKIEDELYALNLLQLTRDYPLSPYCLRYPLDFLLESLPDEVRRRVVVLLDPSTAPVLEAKLFGEDEEAFEEGMGYLEQVHQQKSPQGQPKLRGGDGDDDFDDFEDYEDEEGEQKNDQDEDNDTESEEEFEQDHYPDFFRPIRHHGEYVFWPVDAGGHQWLLCVLHLKRSWSKGPYEKVTDFAVVDPEWSRDGSGDVNSVSAQSRARVRRVTGRLVRIFRVGGIAIDAPNTQRRIWVAPSTVPPQQFNGDGDGTNQQQSSPRWESGVRCFQLVRELLGRVTGYACPGAPGYEDERFFEPGAGWVDADAVRHEMVGMALQRCNAALGGRSGGGGGVNGVNSVVAPNLPQTPPPTRGGMHAMNSFALNRRPSKRTATDADLDDEADDGGDGGGGGGGGGGDGDSPTRQVKRARVSGSSARK